MRLTERLLSGTGRGVFRFFSLVEDRLTGSRAVRLKIAGWAKLTVLGLFVAFISTGCKKDEPDPKPTCYLYITPVSLTEIGDDWNQIQSDKPAGGFHHG